MTKTIVSTKGCLSRLHTLDEYSRKRVYTTYHTAVYGVVEGDEIDFTIGRRVLHKSAIN
jgi:hypothetical protein